MFRVEQKPEVGGALKWDWAGQCLWKVQGFNRQQDSAFADVNKHPDPNAD